MSLSSELFNELEDLRKAVPRSSFYRILIIRGKEIGKTENPECQKICLKSKIGPKNHRIKNESKITHRSQI